MKTFANWVMRGRMQAVVVATVLAVLALLVTPLGLISAAVIALTFLRQGLKEGGLVLGSALLAITGLGGLLFQMPVGTLLVGVLLWGPAAALGAIMGRTASLRLAIEAAAVLAALVVLAQYVLMADPAAFWADALNEFLRERLDQEMLATADLDEFIGLMAGWMAGGMAAVWFLGSVVSLLLARYWSALIDRPGAFGKEFRQLRFGRWLLLLVPVLLLVGVILTGGEPSLVGHLYLVGMMVFLVQGISVAHGLVAEFSGSPAWLVGLYLLLILVAPQGVTMVALVGYTDGWLDFRARARARRSGTGDN
jgi:hypothetical protein